MRICRLFGALPIFLISREEYSFYKILLVQLRIAGNRFVKKEPWLIWQIEI